MKSGIIHSGTLWVRNPYIAFFFSLFFPGLGQIYNGDASRGIIYYCGLTVIAFISPLYLTETAEPSYLLHVSMQCILYAALWISSPVEGFVTAKRHGSIILKPLNSFRVYLAFALVSACTTAITVFMAITLFTIIIPGNSTMAPTFTASEILLGNRFSIRSPERGDTVLYNHGGTSKIGRILGKGGDTVSFAHNTFIINNIPLSLGVFTDAAREAHGLRNDPRLFSEINGRRRYSVYHNIERAAPLIPKGKVLEVPSKHFFVIGDNRTGNPLYFIVPGNSIQGRIEGILSGTTIHRFLQKPFTTIPVQQ